MFEDKTYENLMAEALQAAPSGTDTRQGSVFYDAVAGICIEIAQFYANLDEVLTLTWLGTAPGEYLDRKGLDYGIERRGAESAVYAFSYTGTRPSPGTRFFAGSEFFALIEEDGLLRLRAEEAGESANGIPEGTAAIPAQTSPGLTSAAFGAIVRSGADAEDDESYRARMIGRISAPAENGNAAHYKKWCEECAGIGRARIFPLWDGENTVLARLIGTDGLPAAPDVVAAVQAYIDPDASGLGEGTANIGAYFTAAAAEEKMVNVSFTAARAPGVTAQALRTRAETALRGYFRNIATDIGSGSGAVVRMSDIGMLIYGLSGVIDYTDLRLNGSAGNVLIGAHEVPVLGEVLINE